MFHPLNMQIYIFTFFTKVPISEMISPSLFPPVTQLQGSYGVRIIHSQSLIRSLGSTEMPERTNPCIQGAKMNLNMICKRACVNPVRVEQKKRKKRKKCKKTHYFFSRDPILVFTILQCLGRTQMNPNDMVVNFQFSIFWTQRKLPKQSKAPDVNSPRP